MGSLAQPLPLPSTTDWPEFVEVASIPYGFGREISSPGIPIDQNRTRFAWLAGRNGGVDSVTENGLPVRDWEWTNTTDPAGNPITQVEFATSQTGTPVIKGRGLTDPETGDLIQNPGRVVAFLYSLAGRTASNLDLFTSAADRRSLSVRGVLTPSLTGRAQVAEIMTSVGAIWADSSPDFAVFYPETLTSEPVATAEPGAAPSWALADVYTRIRVRYGLDNGSFLGSVLVQSPDAIEKYGVRVLEVDAGWLATSSAALELANRLLAHVARPRWRYEAVAPGVVYPGQVVTLTAAANIPKAGNLPVLSSRVDFARNKSRVTLEALTGDAPIVETVQVAEALPALEQSTASQTEGEQYEILVTDDSGEPVTEAEAILDGQTLRYTDGEGVVLFPAYLVGPGDHEVVVTKDSRTTRVTFTA